MTGVFLACCVKGLEVTRHFTTWQGAQLVDMVAAALLVAGLIGIGVPLYRAWRSAA